MTKELESARAAVSGAVEAELRADIADMAAGAASDCYPWGHEKITALLDTIATLRSDNERLGRERDEARETNRSLNRRLSKYTGDETAFRMRHLVWSTILCKTPLVPAASGKPGHKDFDFQAWQINVDREYANGRAAAAEAERDTLLAQMKKMRGDMESTYAVALCAHNPAKNSYGFRMRVLTAQSADEAIGIAMRLSREAEPDTELSQPAALRFDAALTKEPTK